MRLRVQVAATIRPQQITTQGYTKIRTTKNTTKKSLWDEVGSNTLKNEGIFDEERVDGRVERPAIGGAGAQPGKLLRRLVGKMLQRGCVVLGSLAEMV